MVFRLAAVVIFVSEASGSSSEVGTLAREEALATIQMGYALGIKFNGKENEALKIVIEMELKDKGRIRGGVGTAWGDKGDDGDGDDDDGGGHGGGGESGVVVEVREKFVVFNSFMIATSLTMTGIELPGQLAGDHMYCAIGKWELGQLNHSILFDNELSRSILQEVGMLRSLVDLELSMNNLTDSIPASIGNLSKLAILSLYNNMLSGHIPEGLCFNGLSVNLTEDFGIYPNLVYIDLSYNNFFGEVSQKWGKCDSLTSLKMSNNNISGEILPEIMDSTQLRLLELSSNDLVGQIPVKLGRMVSLFNLKLDDNHLLGNIPPDFSKLSNLEILNLAENDLSGSIPGALEKCKKLWNLNLSNLGKAFLLK
ncbi:hypothetical protein TEA_011705 [Camellia sinensis var. sinensis]|uniref:Uncharacterized protein n=1 Tax=Camellia sinensis var. sinensis TaxID=542762 RepID=A0A4S4DT16_CAMSN|nr:hypothetical protein TEA_011705 [Camellia sinensis var. sinensis]